MNSLDFLKQAQLADRMGNFRLADKLFNKASRVVFASVFDKALLEALEKAGIKAGGTISREAIVKFFLQSVEAAIVRSETRELNLLLREAGLSDETIEKIIKEAVESKKAPSEAIALQVVANLEKNLNSSTSIFNRMKPSLSDKIQEVGSKITGGIKQRIDALMKNPGAKKMLKAAGIIAMVGGAGWYFVSVNGDPVSDEEVENALTGSEMYDLRMQAGQQQGQNEKAQAYVDANKGKFTSQRDFYNAALGAGDKNFANSVIAIVKKDLDLPIEPSSSSPKESGSNLNKAPYSTS
jgi:hypothetical protein